MLLSVEASAHLDAVATIPLGGKPPDSQNVASPPTSGHISNQKSHWPYPLCIFHQFAELSAAAQKNVKESSIFMQLWSTWFYPHTYF